MASNRSVRERVESAHLKVDKLIDTALAIVKAKPDNGSSTCKRCGKPVFSNDSERLCLVCSERERSEKL